MSARRNLHRGATLRDLGGPTDGTVTARGCPDFVLLDTDGGTNEGVARGVHAVALVVYLPSSAGIDKGCARVGRAIDAKGRSTVQLQISVNGIIGHRCGVAVVSRECQWT